MSSAGSIESSVVRDDHYERRRAAVPAKTPATVCHERELAPSLRAGAVDPLLFLRVDLDRWIPARLERVDHAFERLTILTRTAGDLMDELPNRPDDRVAGRSGRLTLIVSDHLRRVGFAHALLVAAITPIAVLACGFHLYLVGFSPSDLLFLLVAHLIGFCGIAVAMHRYFAHRAFIAGNGLRYLLAVLGMTAGQGTVLFWVSTHRQHHRFADHPGDPHTPHRGLGSRLKRIWNAHMGWMFSHTYANPMVFAKDILADRVLMRISALYPLWVLTGLALPALVGLLVFGGPAGALRGFIWGGLLRMATVHHATFAVNSLGHSFGSRRHDLRDQSRNIAWLAIPTLGDSWHNNHHARPQSARAGQQWWEVDLGYALIRVFEKLRLVSDVRR